MSSGVRSPSHSSVERALSQGHLSIPDVECAFSPTGPLPAEMMQSFSSGFSIVRPSSDTAFEQSAFSQIADQTHRVARSLFGASSLQMPIRRISSQLGSALRSISQTHGEPAGSSSLSLRRSKSATLVEKGNLLSLRKADQFAAQIDQLPCNKPLTKEELEHRVRFTPVLENLPSAALFKKLKDANPARFDALERSKERSVFLTSIRKSNLLQGADPARFDALERPKERSVFLASIRKSNLLQGSNPARFDALEQERKERLAEERAQQAPLLAALVTALETLERGKPKRKIPVNEDTIRIDLGAQEEFYLKYRQSPDVEHRRDSITEARLREYLEFRRNIETQEIDHINH